MESLYAPLEVEGAISEMAIWGQCLAFTGLKGEGVTLYRLVGSWDAAVWNRVLQSQNVNLWPRGIQCSVRCDASSDRLLVWTVDKQPAQVTTWQSGCYEHPLATINLAMSSSGELYSASQVQHMRFLNSGTVPRILDGALAGELILLLTSDGCLRAWRSCSTAFDLPALLLKIRCTIRIADLRFSAVTRSISGHLATAAG